MHFPEQKTIFIHVPKTGGNFFSRTFLRYSDDQMVIGGHWDGQDRFEVSGRATGTKHQGLSAYAQAIGADFANYRVFAIARPPVERMLSFYYSPSRWMKQAESGAYEITTPEAPVDLQEFGQLLKKYRSISDLLDAGNIEGDLRLGSPAKHRSGAVVELLDFAELDSQIAQFAERLGFDLTDRPDQKVNASKVVNPLAVNAQQMDVITQLVRMSRHAQDQTFFDG